jgi:hypothetical protein
MTQVLGAVLKKDRIRMAQSSAPADAAGGAPATRACGGQYASSAHATRARIVSETDSEVLIEVGCSCGRQTLLRCQYPAESHDAPAEQIA